VITKVAGKDIAGADDVSAAVADRKPGDQLEITVVSGGSTRTVTARIGRRGGGGAG
jgi:S1-C subfamily serine protease